MYLTEKIGRPSGEKKTSEFKSMKRITSIDALRAFALLGILLIHARQGFGVKSCNYINLIDLMCGGGVKFLLETRCMLIFNVLFGVSFYIILNKKDYPASKFVWRCFLLALLGLLNRVFFNNDVLFKYGVCGMFLVLIRSLSNKKIFSVIVLMLFIGWGLRLIQLGSFIDPPNRYIKDISFIQFVFTYKYSLLVLAKQFLNGDFFVIYANMAIGYVLGRIHFIESMDNRLMFKHVMLALAVYIVFGMIRFGCMYLNIRIIPVVNLIVLNGFYYSGAVFYWVLFIWLYNHLNWFHKLSAFFEPYGKCGLTNYTMQGFVGIIVFYFVGVAYLGLPFSIVFVFSVVFFVLQALFSYFWLKHFKNGPLEYLWRCATEKKWLPIKN